MIRNSCCVKNLCKIALDCDVNVSDLAKPLVKSNLKFSEVPEDFDWKINLVKELLQTRANLYVVHGFDNEELSDIINTICTN